MTMISAQTDGTKGDTGPRKWKVKVGDAQTAASANTRHLTPRWGSWNSLSTTCVGQCQLSGPCQKQTAVGKYFGVTGQRSERGWRCVRQQSEISTGLLLDVTHACTNEALNPRQRSITSVILTRTQTTKCHMFSVLLCLPKLIKDKRNSPDNSHFLPNT